MDRIPLDPSAITTVDISPTMLGHVRRNAIDAGLRTIETLQCAAEDLDRTQAPFDASISRLGLMLFPSPRGALKAVQSVLKPGAHFAALVFTTPGNNAFMAQPMVVLLRHAAKSPPSPGQPGIFALGGEGMLEYEFSPSDVDCHATLPAGGRVHANRGGRYHALAKERTMLLCESLEPPHVSRGIKLCRLGISAARPLYP